MGQVYIVCGDVRDVPVEGPFHAVLSDPPYELGFMGKSWDNSGVTYDVDVWAAILDLLHPGAFGMAFGGSRTYHRLACAIEDTGAELHPMIYGWAFGSGFPKATRIDTQIDKAAGAEVERGKAFNMKGGGNGDGRADEFAANGRTRVDHAPATPLAATWQGHRYGKQALKPAIEPICCFQRPYQGRPVDCITETGAGALWVDGGRVGTGNIRPKREIGISDKSHTVFGQMRGLSSFAVGETMRDRWPANCILLHSPECQRVGEKRVNCAPGCAVAALGEQSGELKSGERSVGTPRNGITEFLSGLSQSESTNAFASSTGTAARFFQQVGWQLDQAEPVRYVAKASRRERDAGLEGAKKPLLWSSGTKNPGSFQSPNTDRSARNPHPTVKPIELCRYLATLLLPPPEYAPRRLLIPFGGVGSEAIGAMLAGWDEIVMVEQSKEYCQIAAARVKWWQERHEQTGSVDVKELLKKRKVRKTQPVLL